METENSKGGSSCKRARKGGKKKKDVGCCLVFLEDHKIGGTANDYVWVPYDIDLPLSCSPHF